MIRNISIGIDVGSSMTRVIVGEFLKGEKFPKVIGVGETETKGMRHGYVVDSDAVSLSIKKAVSIAEKTSNIKIRQAFISIGGKTLRSEISHGEAVISKANGEVTNLDITKALENSENNLNLGNKKVIHVLPLSYKLDGQEVGGRIEGLKGIKLEIKTLFITCSSQHLEDLLTAVAEAGIKTIDVVPEAVSLGQIALSERQKIVGSAIVDIGSETVSLSVYEDGKLISLHTFSIGSSEITNDIALGFKIPLEKAESLKIGTSIEEYPKKKLEEIIDARLSDVFELIENHLKKIKRNELLPAGIVFVGGGANIKNLEELSKSTLKLPSKIGSTEIFGNMKTKLRDSSWLNTLGLIIDNKNQNIYAEGSIMSIMKDLKSSIISIAKQLKP